MSVCTFVLVLYSAISRRLCAVGRHWFGWCASAQACGKDQCPMASRGIAGRCWGTYDWFLILTLKTVFLPGTDRLVLACYSSDIVYKEMGRYHVCEWGKMLKTYCMHCNRQVCPVYYYAFCVDMHVLNIPSLSKSINVYLLHPSSVAVWWLWRFWMRLSVPSGVWVLLLRCAISSEWWTWNTQVSSSSSYMTMWRERSEWPLCGWKTFSSAFWCS